MHFGSSDTLKAHSQTAKTYYKKDTRCFCKGKKLFFAFDCSPYQDGTQAVDTWGAKEKRRWLVMANKFPKMVVRSEDL